MTQTTAQSPPGDPMPNTSGEVASHLVSGHGWSVELAVDNPTLLRTAHSHAHGLLGRPDLIDEHLTHSHDRPTGKSQAKRPVSRAAALALLLGPLALVGGCVAIANAGSSSNDAQAKAMSAFDMCKNSVRNHLKAPSTAKFRDYFGDQAPSISGTGDGPYTVISTVDSQNGFGAMIRSSFVCTAEYVGGDQWSAISTVN